MRQVLRHVYLCCCLLLVFMGAIAQGPAVTDDCPYCQLYGQRFRTKVDLYVFQDTAEPHYKYFGVISGSHRKPRTLPRTISTAHVGHTYGTAKILAVFPAGSEFTVESATHEVIVASGEHIGLMCMLVYNGKENALVNAEFIQVHSENAAAAAPSARPNPYIDESIAVMLDK